MMRQVLSEEEKRYQAQQGLERELKVLIRQYFVLEKNCSHSQFSKVYKLVKGDKVLNIFQKEWLDIFTNLSRAIAPGRIHEDEKLVDELSHLLDEYSLFEKTVKTKKIHLVEIDAEIKMVQKAVHVLRKQQITDRQYEDRIRNARRTVACLENKLEVQMIQFGTICAKNKKLREQLEHELWNRFIFMKQWKRLIDKLNEGKKIMLDLIEQATVAYNQREEWCSKLEILRTKALQDFNSHTLAMREYKRCMDDNTKLSNFFNTKGQKRIMRDLEYKVKLKREKLQEKYKETIKQYEDFLVAIKSFTKNDNIGQIATNFSKQEEINLSNFKFIIDAIKEAEMEGDRLGVLQMEIDERSDLHETRTLQQTRVLEGLNFDLDDVEEHTRQAKIDLNETDSILKELLQGVGKIFQICKCDKSPLVELLGDNTRVEFYNVILYLQIIERTLQTLLITAAHKDKHRKPEDPKRIISTEPEEVHIYGIDQIVKATPCSLCVEHEMVSDVIDVLQPIWSKNEVKYRLKARLMTPGGNARLHTISHCQIPKSRQIIQRRYE